MGYLRLLPYFGVIISRLLLCQALCFHRRFSRISVQPNRASGSTNRRVQGLSLSSRYCNPPHLHSMRTRQSSRKNKDGGDTTVSVVQSSGVDKSSRSAESCGLKKRRSTRPKRRTEQNITASRRSKRLEQKEKRVNEYGDGGSNDTDRNTSETSSSESSNSNAEHDEAATARMSGGNDAMVHGGASMEIEMGGNGLDPKEYVVGGSTLGIDSTDDAIEDSDTNTSMDVEVGRIASEPKDSGGTDITLGIAGNDNDGDNNGNDGGEDDEREEGESEAALSNSIEISRPEKQCSKGIDGLDLIMGDIIEVVEGELVGLRGEIVGLYETNVNVKPTNSTSPPDLTIEVPSSHLRKLRPVKKAPNSVESEYVTKVPPGVEPGENFSVFVDGISSIVTCPMGGSPGDEVSFRPFESYATVPVIFRTHRHGLNLKKIPGQRLLQLVNTREGSEGSKNKTVSTLEGYFLQAVGSNIAPNTTESAIEAISMLKCPFVLVFGRPGPSEDISVPCRSPRESNNNSPSQPTNSSNKTGVPSLDDQKETASPQLLPEKSILRARSSGSYTVTFNEETTGLVLRHPSGSNCWIVGRIREGSEAESKPISVGDRIVRVNKFSVGINTDKSLDVLDLIKRAKRPMSITFFREGGEDVERQVGLAQVSVQSVEVPALMNGELDFYSDWKSAIDDVEDCDFIRLSLNGRPRRFLGCPNLPCCLFFKSFATIIDVVPFGNCGFDCLGLGLEYRGCTDVTKPDTTVEIREALSDHAEENRVRLQSMGSLRHVYCVSGEAWWRSNVLDRIYSEDTEYGIQADATEWMEAGTLLPIFVDLFNITVVLYDVSSRNNMTMTTVSPQGRSRRKRTIDVSMEEHFFKPPPDNALAIVFYGSHFYLLRRDNDKTPIQSFDTRTWQPENARARENAGRAASLRQGSKSRPESDLSPKLRGSSTDAKVRRKNGSALGKSVTFPPAEDFTLRSKFSDNHRGEHVYPLTKYIEYVHPYFRQQEVKKGVVQEPYYETTDIPSGFDWGDQKAIIRRFHPRVMKKDESRDTIEGRCIPAKPSDARGCGKRQIPKAILDDAVVPNDPEASNQNRIHLLNLWYFCLTTKQQKDFFELLSTMYFSRPTVDNTPLPATDARRQAQLDMAKAQGLAGTKNPMIVALATDREDIVAEVVARSFSHRAVRPERRRKKSDPVKSNSQLFDKVARKAMEILEEKTRDFHRCTRVDPEADVTGQTIAFTVVRRSVPDPRPRGGRYRKGKGENCEVMNHWVTMVFCTTEEEGRRQVGAEKMKEYEEEGTVYFSATFGNSPYMARQRRKREMPREMSMNEVAENAKKLKPISEDVGSGEEDMPPLPGPTVPILSPRTPVHDDKRAILLHKTPESRAMLSFM